MITEVTDLPGAAKHSWDLGNWYVWSVMCSAVYQYRTVTLHYYSMGLVAKNVSENQEMELFIFLFFGYL